MEGHNHAFPQQQLPESVQSIFSGTNTDATRPVCSKCRIREVDLMTPNADTDAATDLDAAADGSTGATIPLVPPTPQTMLRCSRCKMAHYCSSTCQKKHFAFHKKSCQSIAQDLSALQSMKKEERGKQQEEQDLALASRWIRLGDEVVVLGYRETDTICNGGPYYRQALQHYHQGLQQILLLSSMSKVLENSVRRSTEGRILLLLVLLGGDALTLEEFLQYCHSSRSSYFENNNKGSSTTIPTTLAAAEDTCFQFLSLLVAMRSLLTHRQTTAATAAQATQHQQQREQLEEEDPPTMKLQIQDIIQCIRHSGKKKCLRHLRDTIPLQPSHIPTLFCGGFDYDSSKGEGDDKSKSDDDGNDNHLNGNDDDDDDGATTMPPPLREFWFLFQDCFFLTPGLNSVLHEFVPEEDDDEEEEEEEDGFHSG